MLPTKIALSKDCIYRVIGPASIRVLSGTLFMLGFKAKANEKLVIPRTRIVALKPLEDSEIELFIGEGGGFEEAKAGEEVIDIWSRVCDYIIEKTKEKGKFKVVVLGAVDVGKSSFCTFLANRGFEEGLKVAVIDGDVGQADVGPPSCVSLGIIDKKILSLRQLSPTSLRFIGIDTPGVVKHRVIWSMYSLLEEALSMDVNLIVINTDGWVLGYGAKEYKLSLLQALNPDLIIAIHKDNELDHIVCSINWCEVVKIPSPKAGKRIEYGERKALREMGYLRFLQGAKVRTIDVSDKPIVNAYLFSGVPLASEDLEKIGKILEGNVVYAEKSLDHLIVVLERPVRITQEKVIALKSNYGVYGPVKITYKGFEKGLLIGLLDKNMKCLGIGLIEDIDYVNKTIKVRTTCESTPSAICIGRIKLSEEGKELEKLRDVPF